MRGFKVFQEDGRCVSCHTIEQNFALFTDNRFHNIGVGINAIQADVPKLAPAFLAAKAKGVDVDKAVLSDKKTSELGRFAITDTLDDLGAFKTSTLRNVAVTAPYMHDGSLATLRDVVDHYNNGGVTPKGDKVNDFLSGGIRPLNLTDEQITDLVALPRVADEPGVRRRPGEDSEDDTMKTFTDRRAFLKHGGAAALAGSLPMTLVELAFAKPANNFTFAYISDSHIQHIKGTEFVRNWDRGLIRAVAETNLLNPDAGLRHVRRRPRPARHARRSSITARKCSPRCSRSCAPSWASTTTTSTSGSTGRSSSGPSGTASTTRACTSSC